MKKIIYLLLISFCRLYAQTDSLATISLQEVELKSIRLNTKYKRFPAAIFKKEIESNYAGSQQSLQEYIEDLPGLVSFNRSNYAQDLRISIRGFGARSAFGIRGIKLIIDGIPETTPDGQGQLDNLPLALLTSIELARGPNGLRFGNAAGGVLYLNTLDVVKENFNSLAMQQGSYGQSQFQWTGAIKGDKTILIYHANHSKGDGYRNHSSFSTSLFNAKLKHQLSPYTTVTLQLNATNSPQAKDAGGQTFEEYNNTPRSARDRNLQFNAGEQITHLKSGVNIEHKKGNDHFQFYAFLANRDFEGRLPFNNGGWITLERTYSGQGSNYTRTWTKKNLDLSTQAGYAIGRQSDSRERFLNNSGHKGEMTLNQNESFYSFGTYFIQHLNYKDWTFNAGIRWDNNRLGVDDFFVSDGINSAEKRLDAFSPQAGISYTFSPKVSVFMNHAKSYETPSLSELSADPNGSGGFNQTIEIQKAFNREFGVNFTSNKSKMSLVYFDIFTKNDLVPYRLEDFPGRTFYRNAGSTSRRGWELFISHRFNAKWLTKFTWNSGRFIYTDYESNGTKYDGNRLPGIPNTFGQWNLNFRPKEKWNIRYARTYRGAVFAQDNNQTKMPAFWRDDINASIPLQLNKNLLQVQLGVNNLFNIQYSDNIRINASGKRFYEAAPMRELFVRLQYNF